MARPSVRNIVFELTQACNQRCRFCYNFWRDSSSPLPSPDPALCRKTLRRLYSQVSVGTISFSGGEPTCVKAFKDMALFCRLKGSNVNILTNGTQLSEGDIEDLKNIGLSAVQIPVLSASPEIHEYLTGLPGSWEKATRSLSGVASLMPGKAFAVLVVTRVNAPGIPETLEMIHRMGVKGVMVNRFNLGGLGLRHRDELVLDRPALEKAFADVERFAASHRDMHFVSGVCTPMCVLDSRKYPHVTFTYCSTDFNLRPITVDYSGNVRFCNHSPKVLGNIFKGNITSILESREAAEYFGGIPAKCEGCPHLKPCNGGCRAASEQVYGTFSEADPVLEIL